MINIKIVNDNINNLKKDYKTKDLDELIDKYISYNDYIEYDESLLKNNYPFQRIFFYVNLKQLKDEHDKLLYIDKYKSLFYDWKCTDMLINKVQKCDFDFMYEKANEYVKSSASYTRRWAYVMFITNPNKKNKEYVIKLLDLFKDDDKHEVIMGQAWLLCELAIYHTDIIYNYLKDKKLCYKITSMAISKINDSFRIDKNYKIKFKEIRNLYNDD